MQDLLPLGSRDFWIIFGILALSRAMDFLSTWIATPNLALEANPIARRLGWKYGILFNLVVCALLATWPAAAIIVATTSLLVAARNFKSAWLMRGLGEDRYLLWTADVMKSSGRALFFCCLAGETLLTALVGVAVVLLAGANDIVSAIGLGIAGYAAAVAFYTTLALRRLLG
jgi:hypothetical protein